MFLSRSERENEIWQRNKLHNLLNYQGQKNKTPKPEVSPNPDESLISLEINGGNSLCLSNLG